MPTLVALGIHHHTHLLNTATRNAFRYAANNRIARQNDSQHSETPGRGSKSNCPEYCRVAFQRRAGVTYARDQSRSATQDEHATLVSCVFVSNGNSTAVSSMAPLQSEGRTNESTAGSTQESISAFQALRSPHRIAPSLSSGIRQVNTLLVESRSREHGLGSTNRQGSTNTCPRGPHRPLAPLFRPDQLIALAPVQVSSPSNPTNLVRPIVRGPQLRPPRVLPENTMHQIRVSRLSRTRSAA